MTFDIEVSTEVAERIAEIGRSVIVPKRKLTREECTTPQLRLEYIAQWLEAGGEAREGIAKFCMPRWHARTDCGTTCCIGGAACMFFPFQGMWENGTSNDAAEIVGMDLNAAYRLFFPGSDSCSHGNPCHPAIMASPAWAARCIRKYQREGIVDWEGTRAGEEL